MRLKKLMIAIVIVAVITALLNILYSSTLIDDYKKRGLAAEADLFVNNELCEKTDLSSSDRVAAVYMHGRRGKIECDILKGTSFVEVFDVKVENLTQVELLKKQGIVAADVNASSIMGEYFLAIRLNMPHVLSRTRKKANEILCATQLFDKIYNKSERFVLRVERKRLFRRSFNYTVYFKKHGFYHVSCYSPKDLKLNYYDDSFFLLPRNLSKLMEERNWYESLEVQGHYPSREFDTDNVTFQDEKTRFKPEKKMNVLMLGIDSLSYKHLQRVMPVTFSYLTSELENNVMFTSVNRVGENTFPNTISMLSGILADDIPALNLTSELDLYKSIDDEFYDKYPFIWHRYEKLGYLTGLQQDAPRISAFNYLKKGFRYQPTAFYPRSLWIRKHVSKRSDQKKCTHGRPLYKVYFDMLESLLKKLHENEENANTPYFLFNFMAEYTHDDFMVPPQIDREFAEILSGWDYRGYLKNTLLIVFSDHGSRMVRYAYRAKYGKVERNLPFVSIRLPRQLWGTRFHENLKRNKDKLIGAFDLYQTLRHFLHLNSNHLNEIDHSQFAVNEITTRHLRGISLLERIPSQRSCKDALIPDNFCSCYKHQLVSDEEFSAKTNSTILEATEFVVAFINNLTSQARDKCSLFKLQKLEYIATLNAKTNRNLFEFVVILEPGDAWFEVKLTKDDNSKTKFIIIGKVIRLSVYRKQSHCVDDTFLRNYCFCKDLL